MSLHLVDLPDGVIDGRTRGFWMTPPFFGSADGTMTLASVGVEMRYPAGVSFLSRFAAAVDSLVRYAAAITSSPTHEASVDSAALHQAEINVAPRYDFSVEV